MALSHIFRSCKLLPALILCVSLPCHGQENLRIGRGQTAPLANSNPNAPANLDDLSQQFQDVPEVEIGQGASGYLQGSGATAVRIPDQRRPASRTANLSAAEVAMLQQRDVVLLIDKSGSMETEDCPPFAPIQPFMRRSQGGFGNDRVSRWQWCSAQTMALAQQTAAFHTTITLVPFDSKYHVYRNVALNAIPQVFMDNQPGGSTNVAGALNSQLEAYFKRRAASPQTTKPLVIALISDGLPNSTKAVESVIKKATTQMLNPNEIKITFLHVGNDQGGLRFLKGLDDDLTYEGARADIVDTKTFHELMQSGLARALVDAISEHGERR